MKKLLALLLVLAMMLSFAACGSNESSNTDNDDNETKQTEKKEEENKTPEKELAHGTIDGAVYTNSFLGMKFTGPDTWVYSTDAELAAQINKSVDFLGDKDKYKQTLESTQTVYDMMVKDAVTNTNVQVLIENLAKSNSTNITEDQYMKVLKTQLEGVTSMTVKFDSNFTKVKLGEYEYLRGVADVTLNGVSMKQAYYIHKLDKYMGCVISTVPSGYTVAQVEAMFS